MQKNGTALAILKDGSHVTVAGVYDTFADFRAAIKLHTKTVWLDVVDFISAYGAQVDRFGVSMFRAEFGPPLEGDTGGWHELPGCRVPVFVRCPTCDGTGEVHSHNTVCPTCRGQKFVSQQIATTAPRS